MYRRTVLPPTSAGRCCSMRLAAKNCERGPRGPFSIVPAQSTGCLYEGRFRWYSRRFIGAFVRRIIIRCLLGLISYSFLMANYPAVLYDGNLVQYLLNP